MWVVEKPCRRSAAMAITPALESRCRRAPPPEIPDGCYAVGQRRVEVRAWSWYSRPSMTASMLRQTEPVGSLVPRFRDGVQSERAAAPTSWTPRYGRRPVGVVAAPSRSAPPAIAATRIARPCAGRPRAGDRSRRPVAGIAAAPKAASITAIISAPIGRA